MPFQGSIPFVSHVGAEFRRGRCHSKVAYLLCKSCRKMPRANPAPPPAYFLLKKFQLNTASISQCEGIVSENEPNHVFQREP